MFTNVSETPDLLQQTLQAIHTAANMYGRIPQHLEE
jgi:hypothetical protein